MKLTVDREAFAGVLAQAAKYLAPRSTIPVLSTVLLRAGDGEIEVVATDLDRLFRATIEARVAAGGTIAANGLLLTGFVRGAAETGVELELDGSLLQACSGHARGRIPTVTAADFPEAFGSPASLGFEIDAALLAACLDAVGYAVSDDKEPRFYLSGISWLVEGGRLELAATTGSILSTISIETPAGAEGLKPLIVPDFAMPAFTGPVRVDVTDTWIRFTGVAGARVSVTSRLIDGSFPAYRRIIHPATATARIERKALTDAVGRCGLLRQGKIRAPVDLIHDTEGELVVRVNAEDGAEIEDRIEIEGSQFALSLNGSLLAATLDSFAGETIEIGLAGVGDNVRFSEPGKEHRLAIVMPIRSTLTHRIGPPKAEAAE